MSTLWIIALILIAAGLVVFSIVKKLFKLAIVAVLIALMFAGAFMITGDKEEQLVGGCAGVQANYTQECCDNWATENNIAHIECVGNWTILNNSCSWQCNITPI